MLTKIKKKCTYALCFAVGYISCWYIFNINTFFKFYENIFYLLSYKGLFYFIGTIFAMISYYFIEKIIKIFSTKEENKIANFATLIFLISIMLIVYFLCEKFVKNWETFTINTLNYMLYMFAWYSLIKAIKVWCKYGNFFNLLFNGKIKNYIKKTIIFILLISSIIFSKKIVSPISAIGILLISTIILLSFCFFIIVFIEHSKKVQTILKKISAETEERIKKKEQPKEVSIAYDQISAIGLSAVVGKRIFNTSKDIDLQFIVGKLFKMCCYLISLLTTCKYTKQIKKIKKSLTFFSFLIITLICLSYSDSFHFYLKNNQNICKISNIIIDYLFFPLGVVKILIQIITIIFAKKTTGVSVAYFTISTFFTLITSCNLIAKGNFYDTTITISLYKCFLYMSIVFIVSIVDKCYLSKNNFFKN